MSGCAGRYLRWSLQNRLNYSWNQLVSKPTWARFIIIGNFSQAQKAGVYRAALATNFVFFEVLVRATIRKTTMSPNSTT